MKLHFSSVLLLLLILASSCKTDPLIPFGGIPNPGTTGTTGNENLCPDNIVSFQYEILPLMVSNCAFSGCHDAISREEGVVLDSYVNISREVKPGKPNQSKLYESVTESGDDLMPPSPYPRLTSAEISLIKTWIEQGAENTSCGIPCDSTNTTFASAVMPTLETYCIGCHNDNLTSGAVNLKDYNHVLPYAQDGSLLGSILHQSNFVAMPPSGGPLDECRINQIKNWIDEGAKNN